MPLQVILIRLSMAVILSGLIGLEREDKNRPAGFRTHILVCVGAAVVMLTSQYLFEQYSYLTNMDPGRLGAQVISGIGFLGAGTIIRQGVNVRGLTTAASLWAVACVGLAVGIGFYEGAIAGAVMIYLTLMVLSRFGPLLQSKASHLVLNVEVENKPGKIGEIGLLLGRYHVTIRNIEFLDNDLLMEEQGALIRLTLKLPHGLTHNMIIKEIAKLQGITGVEEV